MSGSQKFLSRNRAPRVQIEYDVEVYGAQKKVQLPFVMGVMADLSGKSEVLVDPVKDRKFLEIDIDNFDSRMKAMKPRAAFSVQNTLSGEGNLAVDLVFEKMSDFSPAAIARKVEPLRKLLEARTQLENLMTYMDGKAGAEELIERLVADPQQLKAIALGASNTSQTDAAFDAIKANAPEETARETDSSGDILAAIAAAAPEDTPELDTSASILADMASFAPDVEAETDTSADVLADIAANASDEPAAEDTSSAILGALAQSAPEAEVDTDNTAGVLAGMAETAPEDEPDDDGLDDMLAGMAEAAPDEEPEAATSADVLAGMAKAAPEDEPDDDGLDDMLADMAAAAPDDEPEADTSADLLAGMAETAPEDEPDDDGLDDMLAGMAEAAPDDEPEAATSADVLAGMAEAAPEDEPDEDGLDDMLAGMAEAAPEDEPDEDGLDSLLSDVSADVGDDEGNDDNGGGDEILAGLLGDEEEIDVEDRLDDLLAGISAEDSEVEVIEGDESEGILAGLLGDDEEEEAEDGLDDLLADVVSDSGSAYVEADSGEDILSGLLGDDEEDEAEDELDALLAGVSDEGNTDDEPDDSEDILAGLLGDDEEDEADDELDALLADVSADDDGSDAEDVLDGLLGDDEDEDDGLDALLSEGSDDDDEALDLEALLGDMEEPEAAGPLDDLDALLADDDEPIADDEIDGLADLLGNEEDLDSLPEAEDDDLDSLLAEDDTDLADLMGEVDALDDLDDLLGDNDLDDLAGEVSVETTPPAKPKKPAFQPDFGTMSAAKLQDAPGARRKFRIAVLGDFSGRGNHGEAETGAALGNRKAFKLDFDTMEDVIARFRTTLKLPLGDDGSAVEVELNELDDLHPDELFENVELFNELYMLRRDLKSGRNFDQNVAQMQEWGGAFGDFRALSKKRSKGSAAPADMRLSDFQSLIGDTAPSAEASSAQDLISRIVGPHIVAAVDNGSDEMIAAVDKALSTAMSSVLHHPDFQSVEAAWRSIELLGRRVESSAELEVVVYDMSVEEFSADLAAQEDMAESGLYDMLVEKPRQDESAGPISAVVGLYTWEETPTHAELLARMARISAHMDAPFISAMNAGFIGIKPEDRHPLVKKTWDALGEIPEAKYLGLTTPRFMLRMPYGQKTEPVDRFDYEEFNVKEGMRSMLMANPALLVAVLLAETKAQQGGDMSLGSIMSLNDMPFHYMTDQYGDQVALPCTERLISVAGAAEIIARGFMPVISVQGQNVVKLGSFQAVGGGELLGIWAGDAAKEMKSGAAQPLSGVGISSAMKKPAAPARPAAGGEGKGGDDDLDLGLDSGGDGGIDFDLDLGGDDDLDLDLDFGDDGDDGLDDLLAGFGDGSDDGDDDEMDADLAALLGDL